MNSLEKILIVEDELFLRTILRTYLENQGYQVLEADEEAKCLEICLGERPDLVLMDINLHKNSGFTICRNLKCHPELGELPVIFLSGLMDTKNKLEAFSAGGVDYVTKPFNEQEMVARIRTHLELRRQRKQLEESRRNIEGALAEARDANRMLIEVNEKLRQSEALKSHFIAHVRNEINEPLGDLLGLAGEICDPRLPVERCRVLASLIKTEAHQLDFQMQNIFCAAELEAGEARPSITRVDVGSVLRNVAAAFMDGASEKNQMLTVEVPAEGDLFTTDAGMLRLVMKNLLANAIEFSPAGGRIEMREHRQPGLLVLEVADQGPGLNDTEQSLIFERFRQLGEGTTRSHKGQGLGLAVVKALAELLGGEILVESQPGHGSTFICRLPAWPWSETQETASFDGNLFIFDEPREL